MTRATADGQKDGFALAREAGASGVLAQLVNGTQRDLAAVPAAGQEIEFVLASEERGREILRHSTAHVMAQAVLNLHPEAKYSIGPPIEDGFYYDFDVERPFTPDDLEAIEAEMRHIIDANQRFEREELDRANALDLFADQPYKVEIIEGVAEGADALDQQGAGGEVISVYYNRSPGSSEAAFVDLCRGPHIPGTGRIKAFKLLRSAGAYWRGDERNKMLQRIYGTAWESKAALDAYLHRLEEAERRDHRRLGRELELYSWPEELGPGLAVWHPKGGLLRKQLEDLIREMCLQRGYDPVYTPHIGKSVLWETSGHLGYYAENMFPPMAADEGDYYAKPMNCPFHILIYKSKTRSYRELPVRLSELGTVYRYERSGVVHGLLRSRGFTQDDSHIFCRRDQAVEEMVELVDFYKALYSTVGLGPDEVHFSTRPDDSVGTDEQWDEAEDAIRQALDKAGLDYVVAEGEGTFYGPKIDVHVRDAIGRLWQMGTIQIDFQEPHRFGLEYTDEHGDRIEPVMIHRALYGSVERFVGVLVEHFAGAFPTWLAPVQTVVIPVADRHLDYAHVVNARLRERGIRSEVDDSDNTMGAKIRHQQLQKVPYMLVVGDKEVDADTVSVRKRTGEESRGVAVDEFVEKLAAEIDQKLLELSL
ncbi:MAG TPA: threonine--tRNA ligase [Actinomycetota bacterium]|jgi:threonyl-tRNA synthetase|nr:threonine--tRNA ligase [Actinomycetota bacterium]